MERTREDLLDWCSRLEGGPYPAYRDLRGRFRLEGMSLEIVRVQPDPFAGPTRIRLLVPYHETALPNDVGRLDGGTGTKWPGLIDPASAAALAWRDWLGRRLRRWLEESAGVGTRLRIEAGGQEVLDRTSVLLRRTYVEIRLDLELPARQRRILGREARQLLVQIPERLRREVLQAGVDTAAVEAHVASLEDYAALQAERERQGWLAFVADGSRLARRAGNDDRPLLGDEVVPFLSPPEARRAVRLPHAGELTGLAFEPGVTLLCGGGFHGKSTLLRALAAGVHAHVPGDGRERIATRPDAMTVRAEAGRSVHAVDLRPFLHNLPLGRSVARFTTENASGSTSQAASILESIQGGSRLLLFDEDTSATNFMIRDELMTRLVRVEHEPITPYLERARLLSDRLGVSSILVIGGSGEYFRVADRVFVLDTFRPVERTAEAWGLVRERSAAERGASEAAEETLRTAVDSAQRRLPVISGDPPRIKVDGARRLRVGADHLSLEGVESLRDSSQGRFLAWVLGRWMWEHSRGGTGTGEGADSPAGLERWYLEAWREGRLDSFEAEVRGDLAAVRFADVLAAVNRLRMGAPTERGPDKGRLVDRERRG